MSTPQSPDEICAEAPVAAGPGPARDVKWCTWTTRTLEYAARRSDPREAGPEDTWVCRDLGLFYTTDGKMSRTRWSQWEESSEGPDAESLEYTAARRFWFNGPRQLYMTEEIDPTTWQLLPESPGEPTQTWTTYLGNMPWADFTLDGDWTPTKVRDYLTGDGLHAQKDTADPPNVEFLHGDLIGSTMLRTDDSGEPVSGFSGITYTAFGEPVVNTGSGWQVSGALPEGYPRYAYAGQFGYESDLLTLQGANEALAPVTLAHVGWRWYQAGIGRFVQRDPVGTRAGANTYAYASDCPVSLADPLGLDPGLAICEYCGRSGGHAPGCPLYCKPSPPPPPAPPRPPRPGAAGVIDGLTFGPAVGVPSAAAGVAAAAKSAAGAVAGAALTGWYVGWGLGWCLTQGNNDLDELLGGLIHDAGEERRRFPRTPGDCPIASSTVCFVAGTRVWTPAGGVPIESVKTGKAVWSGTESMGGVRRSLVNEAGPTGYECVLVDVSVGCETIRCTPEHPFLTKNRGWVMSRELKPGDELLTIRGETYPVLKVETVSATEPVQVFGLHLASRECYYVGQLGLAVHSVCSRHTLQNVQAPRHGACGSEK
jgi:RHS repeat-associated protein